MTASFPQNQEQPLLREQIEELHLIREFEANQCFFVPTIRWFGPQDKFTPAMFGQIPGVAGLITMFPQQPGEVVPVEEIQKQQAMLADSAVQLKLSGVESLFLDDRLKLKMDGWEQLRDNYIQSLHNLGECGVKMVTYNAMVLLDWVRTSPRQAADQSHVLAFDQQEIQGLAEYGGDQPLGYGTSHSAEELIELQEVTAKLSDEEYRQNLIEILEEVVPEAESAGIKLCLHPDDPPWRTHAEIPRAASTLGDYETIIQAVDNPSNCACYCTGALGAHPDNDVLGGIRRLGGERIGFVHLRLTQRLGDKSFCEVRHSQINDAGEPRYRFTSGEVIEALYQAGFCGPIRPDHAGAIFEEDLNDGYNLIGRATASALLYGQGVEIRTKHEGRQSKSGFTLGDIAITED